MPDEAAERSESTLPPKLTARKIMSGMTPVTRQADVTTVSLSVPTAAPEPPLPAAPGPQPALGMQAGGEKDTLKISPEAAAPVAAPVAPGLQASPGMRSERKKDTSRLSVEDARPVAVGLSDPIVKTVRFKALGEEAGGGGKVEPSPVSTAKPAAGVIDAAPGIQSERKSSTSRIDIEAVSKPLEPLTSPTASGGVRTVRIKSGPTAAAFVGTQPIVGVEVRSGVPQPAPGSPAPAFSAGPATVEIKTGAGGSATIRLKRPEGLKQEGISHIGGETARIQMESPAAGAGFPAPAAAQGEAQAAPQTVRIKRPDEAGAQSSPVTGRRTMKIVRPGQPAVSQTTEAVTEDEQSFTQRRTLSVKRQETAAPASERSVKMAQDEAALQGRKGVPEAAERSPERFAWAWCIAGLAAMVIIGLAMRVFWVQLNPKVERSLNWPGRILSFNDSFYKDERGWL